MASVFLRSLAWSTRAPTTASRLTCRNLSTTIRRQAEPATREPQKTVFDYHTVEDLHGMSAAEILEERGTEQERKMRHFTGEQSVHSMSCSVDQSHIYSQLWVRDNPTYVYSRMSTYAMKNTDHSILLRMVFFA